MKITYTSLSNELVLWLLIAVLVAFCLSNGGHAQTIATSTTTNAAFQVSISPDAANILVFATDGRQRDTETGVLRLFASDGVSKSFDNISSLPGEGKIIWLSDTVAYISAAEGILKLSVESTRAQRVVQTNAAGLALSPDKSRFAFWQLRDDGMYELSVRDVAANKVLRQWSLPALYSGHISGFDLVFLTDNKLIARTFDSEFKTPLKMFDVTIGSVEEVFPDVTSVVASGKYGAATVTVGKMNKSLVMVSEMSNVKSIKSNFRFDIVESTGNPRWLIARSDLANIALVDTDRWTIHKLNRSCYPLAVSRSGKVFIVVGGRPVPAPPICQNSH